MLSLGDVLDEKYVLESVLGRGGTGVVFRARHIGLNAPRAIKVMHRELAENEDFLARFLNEAKLAEELRHPHIVTLYDLSPLPDGTPYIVWEYVEGETLAHALGGGAVFTAEEVIDLIGRVAEGLAAAHQRKIVHRDISPDNLMLTRDREGSRKLKVLDFGMAKLVGSLTEPRSGSSDLGVFLGKIGYSSPEQAGLLDDVESLDGRTDVFSLAVVAYRMLVGKLPFRTTSIHAFLYDLTTAPEETIRERFERDLPPHFREVFARALRRNREERTSSMEELKRDLESARRSAPGSALSSSKPRGASRSRILLSLGALGLLVVLLLMRGARPPDRYNAPPSSSSPSTSSSSTLEDEVVAQGQEFPAVPTEPADVPAARPIDPVSPKTEPAPETPLSESRPPPIAAAPEEPPARTDPIPTASAARTHGSLSITSNLWVEVRLDDGPPDETPVLLREIEAGPHLLRVTRPGSPSRLLEVVVREGETTAIHLENERPR
jgi:serine/threonine-protein kinase